jgi:DNA polymerase (family 10)
MQLTQTLHLLPPTPPRIRRKALSQPMLPGMEFEKLPAPQVTNRQIAEVLADVADMIERQNGNPYRVQAYRNAARGVLDLMEPAATILQRGETLPIIGIGERLRDHIAELVTYGSITIQSGLYMQTLPAGVRTLMGVEHIGPITAIRLYEDLGVDSLEKLLHAAQQQRIRRLPGFGPRSEARLQKAAENLLRRRPTPRSLGGVA